MTTLRLVLGDQLNTEIASLEGLQSSDVVLMCEVADEATHVKRHKKKIVYVLSAMRHFAASLREQGINVDYVELDDPQNTGSISDEVRRAVARHQCRQVVVTQPGEHRLREQVLHWADDLALEVDCRADDRFLCATEEFKSWMSGRKQPRMEQFYRHMRRSHNVLMEDGQPVGGKWNYDAQNRKRAPRSLQIPAPFSVAPDAITMEVIILVQQKFADHFGDLEPFHYAVTRDQALAALDHFVEHALPQFGDYQDAMLSGQPWMFHAHIGAYLNSGLLLPGECLAAAEQALHDGRAPLNAVEGFIRQILGWREYVRGLYDTLMPEYKTRNALSAERELPGFYWTGDTPMNCLKQSIQDTQRNAYAHHIQRLMVLGNFALLCGIDPRQVNEWFQVVYLDAYEWVELPNVSGMALYADGGLLASKPYIAGGAYINRMSDYCGDCAYRVKDKVGEQACPFNYLYWAFLDRHRETLASNPRLAMPMRTLQRFEAEHLQAIRDSADQFLQSLTK